MTDLMPLGIIFDVDGTLVDSVDLHAKAWQEAFAALKAAGYAQLFSDPGALLRSYDKSLLAGLTAI